MIRPGFLRTVHDHMPEVAGIDEGPDRPMDGVHDLHDHEHAHRLGRPVLAGGSSVEGTIPVVSIAAILAAKQRSSQTCRSYKHPYLPPDSFRIVPGPSLLSRPCGSGHHFSMPRSSAILSAALKPGPYVIMPPGMRARAGEIELLDRRVVLAAVFVRPEIAHLQGEIGALLEAAVLHIGELVFRVEGRSDVVPHICCRAFMFGAYLSSIFLHCSA